MVGGVFAHYRILEKLGEGGMGIVYKAEDLRLERVVALKFISRHRLADEGSRRRFEREAKAAAALDHPNICTVYEIDEVDDELYIAMACAPGESLADRIARGPLPLVEALEVAAQAAEGLREAHAHGIIHRDVKPSNIFIAPREGETLHVTIMDFGLARVLENSSLTQEGSPLGTPDYMSPEQTSGGRGDERSDIWALGVALYEMIAGRRPFQGPYREAVSYAVLYEEPEPLTAVRSGLPIELDWVVAKALAKPVEERYQSVKEFLVDLRALSRTVRTGRAAARSTASTRPSRALPPPPRRRAPRLFWGALAGVGLLSFFVGGWFAARLADAPHPLARYQLRQLTRDSGLAMTPTISADGNLVAYASDRAEQGGLDIWVQQVSGGGAVRLTRHAAADHSPSFSPDGSRIAFRSERDGGGVYLIPALGGDTQLAAPGGLRPRFSPDGRSLAYYVSPPNSPDGAAVFVASNYGAGPRRLHPEFRAAAMPVWSPASDRIAFWGRQGSEAYDVWITRVDGGEIVKSELSEELAKTGLRLISLDAWDPRSDALIFSGIREDSVNLWRLPIANGRSAGPVERLTLGADEREAGLPAQGRIVYSSNLRRINIWSLPLKANKGEPEGETQRLTTTAAADFSSDVTADGGRIVFRSSRSGRVDLWSQDRSAEQAVALTANDSAESGPKISPDGQSVAYSVFDGIVKPLYVIASAGGGGSRKVCDDCGPPLAWTSDRRHLIYQRSEGQGSSLQALDLSTHESRPVIADPETPAYSAALSRDDAWLAFKGDLDSTRTQLFVTPFRLTTPTPRAEWIPISDGFAWDDLPRWSPDGGLLYFTSDRDGSRCIWARRFNRRKGQPEGEPFAVQHLHRMDLSMSKLSLSEFELAVSDNSLVFPLLEIQGNVWMLEPAED